MPAPSQIASTTSTVCHAIASTAAASAAAAVRSWPWAGASVAALLPADLALLTPHLKEVTLEARQVLHEIQDQVELALMRGGSAAQQAQWLPKLASGEVTAAVATVELDTTPTMIGRLALEKS